MKCRIKIMKLSASETYFIPQYHRTGIGDYVVYPIAFLMLLFDGKILRPSDWFWETISVCDTTDEAKADIEAFRQNKHKNIKPKISYEEA